MDSPVSMIEAVTSVGLKPSPVVSEKWVVRFSKALSTISVMLLIRPTVTMA